MSEEERLAARRTLIEHIGVTVEEGLVDAGGINTAYLEAGAGPDLLLIHGSGGGAVNWYKVLGPLSRDFHVIAPDVVGFGESDKPDAPYDRPFLASWLKDFVDAIGVQSTHVVGESFGGAISLQFAHDYPERVDKLVLMDAGAVGGWEAEFALRDTVSMMLDHAFPTRGRVAKNLRGVAVGEPESIDDPLINYFYGVMHSDGAHHWFWQGRGSAIKAMPKEELAKIDVPTLLLWGEDDGYFPVSNAQAAMTVMPNAQLQVIPECEHSPHLDKPDEMLKAITRFLE